MKDPTKDLLRKGNSELSELGVFVWSILPNRQKR